ncbi:MAG TPA: alpha-glucosidase/alpha-galactosidase, partial [Anaerolineae bacterium]
MNESVVLVGAGSAMFTRGLVADLIRRGQPCDLGLVDIDPHALNVAEEFVKKMIAAKQAPIHLRA